MGNISSAGKPSNNSTAGKPSNTSTTPHVHFYKKIPGKWILAGEHTVLRGGDALVFPLTSQFLEIFYYRESVPFSIELEGRVTEEINRVVHAVFADAFKKLGIKSDNLLGRVCLKTNILFGAGMGASATLCVAVTEFFAFFGYVGEKEMYEFARELENVYHGESSGVDIAVVLKRKPLLFSRETGPKEIINAKLPHLYLSHTGEKGITRDCVLKVKELWNVDPKKAELIDKKMKRAVSNFTNLLKNPLSKDWVETMNEAHSCFYDWGLVNDHVKKHEELLKKHGAQAVKLTGSGGGGFMLSLWKEKPTNLPLTLISCCEE